MKTLLAIFLFISSGTSVWANGCSWLLGSESDAEATLIADIDVTATGQTFVPSSAKEGANKFLI